MYLVKNMQANVKIKTFLFMYLLATNIPELVFWSKIDK